MRNWRWKLSLTPILLMIAMVLPIAAQAVDYSVSTYAGGGASLCSLTPSARTAVSATNMYSINSDPSGNLYYSDLSNGLICKIDTNGNVVRFAGNGTNQRGSDNVQATSTSLIAPMQSRSDISGNIYVSEYTSGAGIRKIAPDGTITTIYNSSHGTTYGGDGGLAINATGDQIYGLAVTPNGEIYFSHNQSFRVRKISTNGYVSLVAGTGLQGSTGDGGPATSATIGPIWGLAVDTSGNVYLGANNYCVRKVNQTTGIISTIAGTCGTAGYSGDGGQATSAYLGSIRCLEIDANNIMYISDGTYNVIRAVDLSTGVITKVAGVASTSGSVDGPSSSAKFNLIMGTTIDPKGDMYVADYTNAKIRKIVGVGTSSVLVSPAISVSGIAIFRSAFSISASGGSNGKITFYANDKKIAGCINLPYTGSSTCSWKPTTRGSARIIAKVTSGNFAVASSPLNVTVSNRSLLR